MSANMPPWRWMNLGTLVEDVGRRRVVLTGHRSATLQTCDERGLLVPLTPEHPRARLIAAAPELLAAAKVGHWVADGPGCKPGCPLCAAILKAEGR